MNQAIQGAPVECCPAMYGDYWQDYYMLGIWMGDVVRIGGFKYLTLGISEQAIAWGEEISPIEFLGLALGEIAIFHRSHLTGQIEVIGHLSLKEMIAKIKEIKTNTQKPSGQMPPDWIAGTKLC